MGTLRGANHSTGRKTKSTKTVRGHRIFSADWYRNNIAWLAGADGVKV
jgi:hypothetical protein